MRLFLGWKPAFHPMGHAGRELELLVAALEDTLGGLDGVQVESPARLRDIDTEQVREVDVAIRFTKGTHDVLIVMECRDRAAAGDVTWIEQIRTKCASVGADRIIAVSASGFTKPAIQKARRYRIEIRTMEQVDGGEIAKHIGVTLERVRQIRSVRDVILSCELAPVPREDWPHAIPPRSSQSDDHVFLSAASGRRFSIRELIESPGLQEQLLGNSDLEPPTPFELTFKARHVATDAPGPLQWVIGLTGMITAREHREPIAPTKFHRYKSEKAEIARRAEFRVDKITVVATTWPRKPARPRAESQGT